MDITGGFPVDIVLFGLVAAFLVLRLRSVLGRRTGFERPPQAPPQGTPQGMQQGMRRGPFGGPAGAPAGGPTIDGRAAEPQPSAPPQRPLPDAASPAGRALARMRQLDPGFDAQRFLASAEQAFRMIVGAYVAGNRTALRSLLTEDTYRAFESAIAAREAAGETLRTEICSIQQTAIEEATLLDSIAEITVRFVSDQINMTLGPDGSPVIGTDAVTEITDIWTFERNLTGSDHTWRLAAARSG